VRKNFLGENPQNLLSASLHHPGYGADCGEDRQYCYARYLSSFSVYYIRSTECQATCSYGVLLVKHSPEGQVGEKDR
jgi:hypothetical protein